MHDCSRKIMHELLPKVYKEPPFHSNSHPTTQAQRPPPETTGRLQQSRANSPEPPGGTAVRCSALLDRRKSTKPFIGVTDVRPERCTAILALSLVFLYLFSGSALAFGRESFHKYPTQIAATIRAGVRVLVLRLVNLS